MHSKHLTCICTVQGAETAGCPPCAHLLLLLVLRELRLRLLERLLLWLLPPLLLLLLGLAVTAVPRGGLSRLSSSAFTPGHKVGRALRGTSARSALTSGICPSGMLAFALAGDALTSRCDLGSQGSSCASDAAGEAAGFTGACSKTPACRMHAQPLQKALLRPSTAQQGNVH
jgi:hypothetical protein